MAKVKALDGKPYAGNPHVRFDEGEVAPAATPRRGSLLYRALCGTILAAGMAIAAPAADVTIEKPYFRWLFNGFGFKHSEANFTALMPDDFRDQRVLKTFAELSPTFGRVYTGPGVIDLDPEKFRRNKEAMNI